MRYRRQSYRYTVIAREATAWTLAPPWRGHVLAFTLGHSYWRPDADLWETAQAIEVVVDLAGVDEDEVDVQLFEDALVIEGRRDLPAYDADTVYHAAGVKQGPFRLELPLVAPIQAEAVQARYERGLLRISLPKQRASR